MGRTLTLQQHAKLVPPCARRGAALLAVALLALPRAASAQDEAGADTPAMEVVVTSSRSEQRLTDAPVATQVITRRDLEASGKQTVAEVLDSAAGVQVVRSFAGAGVQLQGLDSRYVLVLVDGQRVTGRTDGTLDLSRYLVAGLERIEIVRGPSSSLYGSDAMGGVINLITRRARRGVEGDLSLSGGSQGSADASGALAVVHGAFRSRSEVGVRRGDGFTLDPGQVATTGNAHRELALGERVSLRVSDGLTLSARGDYLLRDQTGIDASATGAVFDRHNRTETGSIALASELALAEASVLRFTGHLSYFKDQHLEDQRGSDALDQLQQTREQESDLGAQLDGLALGAHKLTAGAEVIFETLRTERLTTGVEERRRGALYLQDEWRPLQQLALVLVPGARIDLDSQFGAQASPKVALRFDPLDSLTLRASWGLGFHAPDFKELYLHFENPGVGYVVEGNPQLRPETSQSVNLGAEATAGAALWVSANLFRNQISDLIQAQTRLVGTANQPTVYTYANVSRAHTQGLELTVRSRPLSWLSVELGYSLLQTEDEALHQRLEGRPLHRGSFEARGRWEGLGLECSVRGQVVGRRPFFTSSSDGSTATVLAPVYAQLDARASKSLGPHLSLFVRASNLLDAGDPTYLPIAPRAFSGGALATF